MVLDKDIEVPAVKGDPLRERVQPTLGFGFGMGRAILVHGHHGHVVDLLAAFPGFDQINLALIMAQFLCESVLCVAEGFI